MARLAKVIGLIVLLVLLPASFFVARALVNSGQFTTLDPVALPGCLRIEGAPGAEDIDIDRRSGIGYVSSLDRRRLAEEGEESSLRGEIYALDLSDPGRDGALKPLTGGVPADFRPHGISLLATGPGEKRLFAVNHRADGSHSVEIFRIAGSRLQHLRTVRDRLIDSPNDVLAVGPERFYVTNDGGGSGIERGLDFVLQRERANVVYFDGAAARLAAKGFVFANGIAANGGGGTIYVADTTAKLLAFFRRDRASGALTRTGSLFLGSGLDNIDVDPEGALWIAAHPKVINLFVYMMRGGRAPTQVIKAVPRPEGGGEATIVFQDDGGRISAGTVAATYAGRLLIGSVMDRHMLLCTLPADGNGA